MARPGGLQSHGPRGWRRLARHGGDRKPAGADRRQPRGHRLHLVPLRLPDGPAPAAGRSGRLLERRWRLRADRAGLCPAHRGPGGLPPYRGHPHAPIFLLFLRRVRPHSAADHQRSDRAHPGGGRQLGRLAAAGRRAQHLYHPKRRRYPAPLRAAPDGARRPRRRLPPGGHLPAPGPGDPAGAGGPGRRPSRGPVLRPGGALVLSRWGLPDPMGPSGRQPRPGDGLWLPPLCGGAARVRHRHFFHRPGVPDRRRRLPGLPGGNGLVRRVRPGRFQPGQCGCAAPRDGRAGGPGGKRLCPLPGGWIPAPGRHPAVHRLAGQPPSAALRCGAGR